MNSPSHEQMWLQMKVKCLKQVNQLGKGAFKTLYKNRRKERKMKTKTHAVTCQIFNLDSINVWTIYSARVHWILCWTPQAHLKVQGLSHWSYMSWWGFSAYHTIIPLPALSLALPTFNYSGRGCSGSVALLGCCPAAVGKTGVFNLPPSPGCLS